MNKQNEKTKMRKKEKGKRIGDNQSLEFAAGGLSIQA